MAGRSTILKIDILGDESSAVRSAKRTEAAYDKLDRTVGAGTGPDRARSKIGRLGASFGGAVRRYGPLAALAAGGAVLKLGADSIKAASDVEQAFGGVDSVFGANSSVVKKWAEDAATNVGLAKSEFANLATVLGSSLKNSGIEDYAGETQRLIGLGADLAATFGGTTSDAVSALSSLLRGETDPIERYGVSIKQSDVQARLAAEGQDKLTGAALKTAEQQARLKLAFEQTTGAQGAFSRESDTLAGQQQRLSARFENLKSTLGEKLLPVATRVVEWLSDTVAGSNDTSKFLRKLGDVAGKFLTPIVDTLRAGGKRLNDTLNDVTGGAKGSSDGIRKIGEVVEKWAPIVGKFVSNQLEVAFDVLDGTIRVLGRYADGIAAIGRAADAADEKLGGLLSKLGGAGVNDALSQLSGLFRGRPTDMPGLARAEGLGLLGVSRGAAPRVTLNPAFTVFAGLDGNGIIDLIDVRIDQRLNP